ncbi:MAG: IS1096 element passenger TnpR family protein [Nostoc sp.]
MWLKKFFPQIPQIKYPVCLAVQGACPPENCGGIWGYAQLLEVIADPKHPEYPCFVNLGETNP